MMKIWLSLCLTGALFACGAPAAQAQSGADFSRMVFVGDSLTAGFQDGALHAEGQAHAYPVLVGRSIGTPVVMPLIGEPGVPDPNPATFTGLLRLRPGMCSVLGVEVATGHSAGRLDPRAQPTDIAVPGQDIGEALTRRWDIDPANPATIDTIEDLILGLPAALDGLPPSSQIETAVRLRPTFVVVWLGSNDALGAALRGTVNDDNLTPLETFRTNADAVFGALGATGAGGVVVNVPDVTISPFLFSIRDIRKLLKQNGITLSSSQIQTLFGIREGSYVVLTGVQSIARGQAPTPDQILTKREVRQIRDRTRAYNDVLRAEADARGWAYVDANAFLSGIDRDGYAIPGFGTITTDYLGGLFSLDGVHPTNTGQALIANIVIDGINAKYGTQFVGPNVPEIAAADPETCNARREGNKIAPSLTLDEVNALGPVANAAREFGRSSSRRR